MRERLSRAHKAVSRRHRVKSLDRLSGHISSLSPGDKAIAYGLGILVAIVSITGVLALERSFLIEVPAYGGSLSEGIVGSPRFVNPLLALSDADRDLTTLTYAGLLGIGSTGNLVPVLAESYTVSNDGKTYVFALRPNAKFSDGTPVTADDVVYTVTKAQDPALKSPAYANWAGVSAIAINSHTVQFSLAKAYTPFLQNATLGILPSHLWRNIPDDQFPFSNLNTEPVGAGPFMISSVTRDKNGIVQTYQLSSSKNYILGRPYLDTISFTFYAEQTDLADAIRSGKVESAYGVTYGKTLRAPYSRVFGVFWNGTSNPVFARPEVRKALSLALNRNELVDNVLGGFATPLMGPVPPGSGITETAVASSTNPIADAAKVLEDAGWTYDGDAREWKNAKDSMTLSITLKTSNVPELKAVAAEIKAEWEKFGVPVEVQLYEPGDLTQNVIRPRKYDALLFGMVIGRDRDLYAFWHSSERSDPGLNIALYTNHAVDGLLEAARQENDPAKASEDLQQVNDLIAADYPAAFTHAPDFLYSVPSNLQGVALPQITSPSDRFASVAKWHRSSQFVWPFLANTK
jgi:peptide/nickel transport system substrate-binding protein